MKKDDLKNGGAGGRVLRTMKNDVEKAAEEEKGDRTELKIEEEKEKTEEKMVKQIREEAAKKAEEETLEIGKKTVEEILIKPTAPPKETKKELEEKRVQLEKELGALIPQKKQIK